MNQKYLCGVAVNGQEEEILAYFEATPENQQKDIKIKAFC